MRVEPFDLQKTMESGQFFNYIKISDTNYIAMSDGSICEVTWNPDKNELELITEDESYWKRFFALDVDYSAIDKYLEGFAAPNGDIFAFSSIEAGKGIRILNQDLFETCCAFIISQQNNMPRIRKLIFEISKTYSKPIIFNSPNILQTEFYPFPSYDDLKSASCEDLRKLGLGYRAEYIYEFVQNWPEVNKKLGKASSMESDFEILTSCKGIGKKVANCILLFGLGYLDAFPIDVWMQRVIDEEYIEKGLELKLPEKYAGILQQYMFWYKRNVVGK